MLRSHSVDGIVVQRDVTQLVEQVRERGLSIVARTFFVRESPLHEWKHAKTRIDIGGVEGASTEPFQWTYPTALVIHLSLSIDEFLSLLGNLVEQHQLRLADLPAAALDARPWSYEYLPSNNATFNLRWPAHHYHLTPSTHVGLPPGPFLSADYPLFVDPYALIREHLDLHFQPGSSGEGDIDLLVSTASAKIQTLVVGRSRLSIRLQIRDPSAPRPVGKVHIIDQLSDQSLHQDLEFDGDLQSLNLGLSLGEMLVCLADGEKGELLDFRHFRMTPTGLSGASVDVQMELPSEDELRVLILQGENDRVEFKSTIRNAEDLAETLVAFANTKGGLVIVGVDNRGQAVGFAPENPENTVQDIIRSYCEPVIAPRVETTTLEKKPLLLIRVAEGPDKPYALRNRGILVRAGSTDRAATRYEVDAIYEERRRVLDVFDSRGNVS